MKSLRKELLVTVVYYTDRCTPFELRLVVEARKRLHLGPGIRMIFLIISQELDADDPA